MQKLQLIKLIATEGTPIIPPIEVFIPLLVKERVDQNSIRWSTIEDDESGYFALYWKYEVPENINPPYRKVFEITHGTPTFIDEEVPWVRVLLFES